MSMVGIACRVLHYLIMAYGVYVCWTAYRHSRKRAWLFVGAFCLSAFLLLGMRQLGKAIHGPAPEPPRQSLVVGEDGHPVPATKTIRVALPIAPLLLVMGLSHLAADEKKRIAPDPPADEGSAA